MIRWIRNLFEGKNTRKNRVYLTEADVIQVEQNIGAYNRDTIMEYFNISQYTYYQIKKGKHRHSTRKHNE